MTDQYIITEKQFRPMIIELFRRIGEQLELKEEWNKLYNAERTAMAGDFYNIIIKNSNPYNPHAEQEKVLELLNDLRRYANGEYKEADLSDNEHDLRIHLEYENRIWGIMKELQQSKDGE